MTGVVPDFAAPYAGRPVAVTGGGGYIGGALVAALTTAGAHVLRLSRRALTPLPGVVDLQGDPAQAETWHGALLESEVVFHLAGETSVYAAAKDPAASLRAAVLPIIRMAQAFATCGKRPMVVQASTATVFGLPKTLPVSETAPTQPLTHYDTHKLMAEMQLAQAVRDSVLAGCALRLANVYGPSPHIQGAADRGILNRMVRLAAGGNALSVYGDGSYIRDYVFIDDVVAAFLAVGATPAECGTGRAFTVASGTGTSLCDAFRLVAERVGAVTGRIVELTRVEWPAGAAISEFRHFVGRFDDLANSVGWRPTVTLSEGIDRTLAAVRAEGEQGVQS